MIPGHHGSPPSPPPNLEPSQPSLLDSMGPPIPMDAMQSIREIYETIDPVDQVGQIDMLISFVENHIKKMNDPSEAESSSSEGWLGTVRDMTNLAAKAIDTISSEAEKLSDSDAVGSVTLNVMQEVGDSCWVFIGLSVAAYAVELYTNVRCTQKECKELFLKTLELSKHVKQYSEQMPMPERGELRNGVRTIVEGAVICCEYLKGISRLLPATEDAQLKMINQQLKNVTDFLTLSSLKQYWDKDVFLSHSGKQKNFIRQLHRDLTDKHVSCFFDQDRNSLPLGERFPSIILKAAETCKIAVVVLSEEFIRSKWPMIELSTFIRAKKSGKNANLKLLLIFFMISPEELSHITKDSVRWKELEESEVRRQEWQDALKEARSINGLHFRKDGNEVHTRDEVVTEVLKLMNPHIQKQLTSRRSESSFKLLDFEPVGIEKEVGEVKALLDMEGAQSALAVIVCGLGGIGKTTLAASVVQSLHWSSTELKVSMVTIDDTIPKTSHILNLQKYIIRDLQGVQFDLRDPLHGRRQIKEALKNKCSLIFIDNVVKEGYVRDLLPEEISFDKKEKLRIIITSRERNVKSELNSNIKSEEYEVKGLTDAASKSFLLKTILQSQGVKDNDEEPMINEVAVECRGVPLLLSVFGNHLRGGARNKDSYKMVLKVLRGNLENFRDGNLGKKLMFVFDKINSPDVKEAFLDICKYFHGWDWNLVIDILDFDILDDLHGRALVSKSGSGTVIVHDILKSMGVTKAKRSRFSNYKEFSDALERNLVDFQKVAGISLVNDTSLVTIQSKQLKDMHCSLRVLMLGDWVRLDGSPCDIAFRELRYLSVGDITAFPFKNPSTLDNLRVLVNRSKPGMNLCDLPSSLQRISYEVPYVECNNFTKLPFTNLRSLKSFDVITQKSVELPSELYLPPSLEHLNLKRCKNLPKDIGHLTALESLILDGTDLECPPQGFGKLQNLKYLRMAGGSKLVLFSKLVFLCEELGNFSSLEALSIEGAYMGDSLLMSKKLGSVALSLNGRGKLKALPDILGKLRIQKLTLCGLSHLQKLPNSFGNMPLLKDLILESCHSIMSLPDSFVQLRMLETLRIRSCILLKELPRGFGTLPALKTLTLNCCESLVNLSIDFTELTSLEGLCLESLPLKRIPDGFGKLERLRILILKRLQLKTLPNDFENMATLEQLSIGACPDLKGTMMEKILKLQNCSVADIRGSTKLSKMWKQMQCKIEHPIPIFCGDNQIDREVEKRAIMTALLNEKCMEVNNTSGQLIERSSLLVGLKEGTSATVALIILGFQVLSVQNDIQRFVEMVREKKKPNKLAKLQIVCAREYAWYRYLGRDEWPTPTDEEEKGAEEDIRKILLAMPKGSCALSKRVITSRKYYSAQFFIGHCVVDTEGRKSFENFDNVELPEESQFSGNVVTEPGFPPSEMKKQENKLQNFIASICYLKSHFLSVAGQNQVKGFIEALKDNGIHHLDIKGGQVMVDDLHGKTIGFIICNSILLEWIKLTQVYKDLQQDSNLFAISIPIDMQDGGHGSYTRLSQDMPWATILCPKLLESFHSFLDLHYFVVLDKEGQIANQDALGNWGLLRGWGLKFYPFTEHSIRESLLMMKTESLLEILLHGMNIVGPKPIKTTMTFLCAARGSEWREMKCKLEQLTQVHGDFEVLYVGKCPNWRGSDIEDVKQEYVDATQNMPRSLSFSDWIMFWHRCSYFASNQYTYRLLKESNIIKEGLNKLAWALDDSQKSLVLVDNDGIVTYRGEDVLEMICELSDDISNGEGMAELIARLRSGECSRHPQHRVSGCAWEDPYVWEQYLSDNYVCNECLFREPKDYEEWSYVCTECEWFMCGSCSKAYAKQQAQQLVGAKDN